MAGQADNYFSLCQKLAVENLADATKQVQEQSQQLRLAISLESSTRSDMRAMKSDLREAKRVISEFKAVLKNVDRPCICGRTSAKKCSNMNCKKCCTGCPIHRRE